MQERLKIQTKFNTNPSACQREANAEGFQISFLQFVLLSVAFCMCLSIAALFWSSLMVPTLHLVLRSAVTTDFWLGGVKLRGFSCAVYSCLFSCSIYIYPFSFFAFIVCLFSCNVRVYSVLVHSLCVCSLVQSIRVCSRAVYISILFDSMYVSVLVLCTCVCSYAMYIRMFLCSLNAFSHAVYDCVFILE